MKLAFPKVEDKRLKNITKGYTDFYLVIKTGFKQNNNLNK